MLIPFLAAVLVLIGEGAAFAYVDPGTGSLLYQTALTIVLGLGLTFRRVRASIADFVKRLAGRGVDSERGSDPGDESTQGS